ncbi:LuxR C-terminal-related transcriptional regulator [Candidatus Methylomirabilis sp.]|uniref:LuxR C-terminal-related transcriptional regulator n=1 Tax=Candidatus Methylomirabilis sp. TaxID=2032687 RepID=UPI002A5C5445|nr:LuxR C-terminal-related transcriptional regulator [Candidatus Methylomirabilis sp.]
MARPGSGSKRLVRARRISQRQDGGVRAGEVVARSADEENEHRPVIDEKGSRSEPGNMQPVEPREAAFKLFAETADGVFVSAPSGEILFCNQAAETILEASAQQVVGQECREFFNGRDSNGNQLCQWPCPLKMSLSRGDLIQHFEMATRTRTGKPLWIDVSCVALPCDDNQPPTVVHLFRDVTAAHQLEVLVRQQLAQTQLATSEEAVPTIGELTRRELQVVTLMRTGATTAAIAEQLFISKTTVRNHIQNIFSKLKVHSRLEAVAYVNEIARREPTTRADAGSAHGATKEPPRAA